MSSDLAVKERDTNNRSDTDEPLQINDKGDRYEGELSNAMREGFGTMTYANGNVYKGQWKASKKEGRGIYTRCDGTVLDGEWLNDKIVRGKKVWNTKTEVFTYNGTFVDGIANGKGILTVAGDDPYSYIGDVVDGKPHGYGRLTFGCIPIIVSAARKTRAMHFYIGGWRDGRLHGQGKITTKMDGTLEGLFEDGGHPSKGTIVYTSGNRYVGDLRRGDIPLDETPEGQGVMTFKDGSEYTGSWRAGERSGYGVQRFFDGTLYEGEWKENVGCCLGKVTIRVCGPTGEPKEHIIESIFVKGEPGPKGKIALPSGDRYEGEIRSYKPFGHGTLTFKNGDVFTGVFGEETDRISGTMLYSNGERYTGTWRGNLSWRVDSPTSVQTDGLQYGDYVYHGRGSVDFPTSVRSDGLQYGDYVYHGRGRIDFPTGDYMKGAWVNGLQHGDYVYHHHNGGISKGRMTNGIRNPTRLFQRGGINVHCLWDEDPFAVAAARAAATERRCDISSSASAHSSSSASAHSSSSASDTAPKPELTCTLPECRFDNKIDPDSPHISLICDLACVNRYHNECFDAHLAERKIVCKVKSVNKGRLRCRIGECYHEIAKVQQMTDLDTVKALTVLKRYGKYTYD